MAPMSGRMSATPDLMHDAVGPSRELSRQNARLAIGIVLLVLAFFSATFGVALLYLG